VIHRTAVIGDGVELGERVTVGPGAVLLGPMTVGDGCWIGPGVVLGTPPEITNASHDTDWHAPQPHHGVAIGARTVIRELSTVHQGSHRTTTVGPDSWLLNRSYVAHDCQVGGNVTLSAGVSLGGHVQVGDRTNIGMNAVVHQRRVIGPGAMVGMGSVVTRDVPPHALVYGNPARLRGVNRVGMRRAGIPDAEIERLAAEYGARSPG
jgi:UDP-N-acetylglucosamine acyltransferase